MVTDEILLEQVTALHNLSWNVEKAQRELEKLSRINFDNPKVVFESSEVITLPLAREDAVSIIKRRRIELEDEIQRGMDAIRRSLK